MLEGDFVSLFEYGWDVHNYLMAWKRANVERRLFYVSLEELRTMSVFC